MLALVSSSSASEIGCCVLREERELLLRAVLVDLEVVLVEIGDVLAVAVGDRHVQRDELDAAAEPLLRARDAAAAAAASDEHARPTTADHLFASGAASARAPSAPAASPSPRSSPAGSGVGPRVGDDVLIEELVGELLHLRRGRP